MAASAAQQQQYDYQRTITVGQYGRGHLAEFARSYGEELRRRTESDVSTSSTPTRSRRKHLRRRANRVILKAITACWRVVLPNLAEWIYLIVLAILMASLSFFMDWLIHTFGKAHQHFYKLTSNVFGQYLLWILFPIVFIFFSVGCCQIVSTHAIGSGIPEMKTVLRGIDLHNYLSIKTLLAKTLGLATAVGSSLPIGKEGPFVHMSSILAHTLGKLITRFNKSIYNEGHNYELLAAACALGVSCNFAAPIGGVLFSIEVTSTYFAVRNYWRGFFGAVTGAFLFQIFAVWFQQTGTITTLFKTSFALEFPYETVELIAFALVGALCGVLAAVFVYFHRQCVLLLRKYRSKLKIRNIRILDKSVFVYPALLTVAMTTLTFPNGTGQWLGGELTQQRSIDHFFSNVTWNKIGELERLNEDSFDFELATHWRNPSIYLTLSLFFVTKFFFTAFANTLPVPAGVFFPVFILGASLGRLTGEILDAIFYNGINRHFIGAGGYAVVGAAAMAGGVTHTISTSVIVFELTGQITHILPVMIAVLISNAIASLLQPSFYDSIILLKSLPFLPDLKTNQSYTMTVRNFMRRHNLFFISPQTTFGELQDILTEEPHSSYPLIDNPESKVLLGSIRRENLADLLRQHLRPVRDHKRRILANYTGDEDDVVEIDFSRETSPHLGNRRPSLPMRYRRVRHSLINSFLSIDEEQPFSDIEMPSDTEGSIIFPQELTNLENELLAKTIPTQDVQVDPAPFQLVEETSLYKAHSLFALLGLSHSFVTKNGKLVGVVTLADLVNAVKLGEAIKQHPQYVYPPEEEMRQLGIAGRRGSDPSPDELHSDVDTLTEESDQLQN